MARDLSGRIMIGGIVAAALALAVTAAVTFATVAHSQPAGTYVVVLTNLTTGIKHPWTKRTFPGQDQCDAAVGNINAALRAIAGEGEMPDTFTGSDPDLVISVDKAVGFIIQNTGRLPNLTISCEPQGDPV